MTTICDKCGKEVSPSNDATIVEAYYYGNSFIILQSQARHFLPVFKNGVKVCEGSPSRAQYIKGQPKDSRGYGYHKEFEKKMREAYRKTLEFAKNNP